MQWQFRLGIFTRYPVTKELLVTNMRVQANMVYRANGSVNCVCKVSFVCKNSQSHSGIIAVPFLFGDITSTGGTWIVL